MAKKLSQLAKEFDRKQHIGRMTSEDVTLKDWEERQEEKHKSPKPVLSKQEEEWMIDRTRAEKRRELLSPLTKKELKRKHEIEKVKKKTELFGAQAQMQEAKARRKRAVKMVRRPVSRKPRKRSKFAKSVRFL